MKGSLWTGKFDIFAPWLALFLGLPGRMALNEIKYISGKAGERWEIALNVNLDGMNDRPNEKLWPRANLKNEITSAGKLSLA